MKVAKDQDLDKMSGIVDAAGREFSRSGIVDAAG